MLNYFAFVHTAHQMHPMHGWQMSSSQYACVSHVFSVHISVYVRYTSHWLEAEVLIPPLSSVFCHMVETAGTTWGIRPDCSPKKPPISYSPLILTHTHKRTLLYVRGQTSILRVEESRTGWRSVASTDPVVTHTHTHSHTHTLIH